MAHHVLVVDEDVGIRNQVAGFLERDGYRVSTRVDGRGLERTVAEQAVDLVVLDVALPGRDGLTLCRDLRRASRVPVMFLSARDDEVDRVLGFEMGADDYVAKPFSPRELLARVRAILARARGRPGTPTGEFLFGGHRLDLTRRELVRSDGVRVALRGAEFDLLAIFLANPNRVMSRDMLVGITQARAAPAYDRSIDVRVSRLRRALAQTKEGQLLKTVYGAGYVLSAKVEHVA